MKEIIGVVVGKFLPLHRGHLHMILKASTMVDKLYIIVSQNREVMKKRCIKYNVNPISLELIAEWLYKELGSFSGHIKIITIDETNIPEYPNGLNEWSILAKKALVNNGVKKCGLCDYGYAVDINFFIGSENGYDDYIVSNFNNKAQYKKIDVNRNYIDISATRLLENVYNNWEMLPDVVKPHFIKKVLLTGTESCGKTTLTQKLAKNYLTSFSLEYGRFYEENELGGFDGNWKVSDFEKIAMRQLEQDEKMYKIANKIVFVDTDTIVTDFYLDMYLNKDSTLLDELKKQEINKWDMIIMLKPDVKWVADGSRWNSSDDVRWALHYKLCKMYDVLGINYIEIDGNYYDRFNKVIELTEKLLKNK